MATKKAGKKKASKKPAARTAAKTTAQTEQIVVKAVAALRKHPEQYKALRKALQEARSDEERAKQLIKYATSERELAALLPARGGQTALITITTVTVTTVLVPNSAY